MTNNSVTKLPRSILAKITGGDNQAIKAFENLEYQSLGYAEKIEYLETLLATAQNDIIYSTRLANEALDAIKALQRLPPVPVYAEQGQYLPPVSYQNSDNFHLSPVSHQSYTSNHLSPVSIV